MASKYSEYSRLRSVARKRAERLAEAGLSKLVTFPTVKELKAAGIKPEQALKQVESFLKAPTQTRQYRRLDEQQRPVIFQEGSQVIITEKEREKRERRRAQNRESARRYRKRKKELTSDEKRLLESAKTLGIKVTPRMAKVFQEYMKYRYDMVKESEFYLHEIYVESFVAAVKAGHSPEDIVSDFEEYLRDRREWIKAGRNIKGMNGDAFNKLFSKFIKRDARKTKSKKSEK